MTDRVPCAEDLDALLSTPFEKRPEIRVPRVVAMFGDVIWRKAPEPELPGNGWTRRWKRPKPSERHRFALTHRPFEGLMENRA
jgi:hypothetical protein